MKISIVGRHPSLEYGFNGVMSLNWLRGFFEHGCQVELLLPQLHLNNPTNLLARGLNFFGRLDKLPRWGCDFDIRPISHGSDISKNTDVVVWQSYRPEEHSILKDIKKNGFFVTKNVPRAFAGNAAGDLRKSNNLRSEFNLVAFSLMSDFQEAIKIAPESNQFAYVPRGFDTLMLDGLKRDNIPTIGFDKAVKAEDGGARAMSHIIQTAKSLNSLFPEIRYLSIRERVKEINSQRIPGLNFSDFYAQFVNRLWVYMPIDFMYSVHKKGLVVNAQGETRYLGLYENQIVEVQLAGGLIVARRGDIPEELIMLPDVSIVDSYDDIDAIVEIVAGHINNFQLRSETTQNKSIRNHSYSHSARLYLDAISRLTGLH